MAIPILNELNSEITRLYAAGAALAKGDPRIKKYISPLEKLGEKAPVFTALAKRLTELTEGDDKSMPENLMEAGALLNSILHTQGGTSLEGEIRAFDYSPTPLSMAKTPYSKLNALEELLRSQSQAQSIPEILKNAYDTGEYKDPRLFTAYVDAIGNNKTLLSSFVIDTIIPSIGRDMEPFLRKQLDILSDEKRHGRIFELLYKIIGRDILPFSEQVLAEDSGQPVLVQALLTMGEDLKYEDTLLVYAKDRKIEVRKSAYGALAKLNSPRGNDVIYEEMEKANINHLEYALVESRDRRIAEEIRSGIISLSANVKGNERKLKLLLYAAALRNSDEDCEVLSKILSGTDFYDEYADSLDLGRVIVAMSANDRAEEIYNISNNTEILVANKLWALTRLYPADKVYNLFKDTIKRQNYFAQSMLIFQYCTDDTDKSDECKSWDRRWAQLLIDNDVNTGYISRMIYNDDVRTWDNFIKLCCAKIKKKNQYHNHFIRQLVRAYKNNNPHSKKYYKMMIKAGCSKEEIDDVLAAEGIY